MVELSFDKLQEKPPFTYCGVDCWGLLLFATNERNYANATQSCSLASTCAIHIEFDHFWIQMLFN